MFASMPSGILDASRAGRFPADRVDKRGAASDARGMSPARPPFELVAPPSGAAALPGAAVNAYYAYPIARTGPD